MPCYIPFMVLQSLSDSELLLRTEHAVSRERELTTLVLDHLREIERRRLFAKLGYSSMFRYCTLHLKYCPASAQLRIDAMRLSQELPEVRASLETGSVSLSSVGMLQKFIRLKKTNSTAEKRELFQEISGKSKNETEKFLSGLAPELVRQERVRVLTPEKTELRLVADGALLQLIDQMRSKLRQKGNVDPTLAEIFEESLKKALGIKLRPAASPGEVTAEQAANPFAPSIGSEPPSAVSTVERTPSQRRPYLAVAARRAIREKSQGRCTFVSPLSGQRCLETRGLQIEHILPFAQGGPSTPENLTHLCAAHNRLRAIERYGPEKMRTYLK